MKKKVISKLISMVLTIAMVCSCVLTAGMTAAFADETVTVSLSTATDVVGNNFYADKMPMFNINLSGAEGTYDVVYKAFDKDNRLVWSKSDRLSIGTAGIAKESVKIDEAYFGVMKFEIKLYQNGAEKGTASTYYSLSNHRDDMPHNYRSGIASQVSWYQGSEEEHVSLMNGAGLAYLRSNDLGWGNMEIEKGKFSLVEDNVAETEATKSGLDKIKGIRTLLSGLAEKELKYIALLGVSNPLYNPDTPYVFGGTDEEYARLQEYTKYLSEQTTYPIDIIEVTNEWHSSDMTNSVENSQNADMLAKIHKAVYDGVTSATADNKPKVSGIDEDAWGLYGMTPTQAGQPQNGMIPKYIDAMQSLGIKPYDYVSLHPYTEVTTPFELSVKANVYVNELKELLESENYMAPFLFTELGWNNQGGVTDEQQAAWLVRANAYIQQNDMAEIVCNYHMMDYTKGGSVAEYGLVENMTTGGDSGVPYLAKDAYIAMAYYNGLMAYANQDDITLADIDASSTDDYCYSFAPAEAGGERVLMYGLKTEDAVPVNKFINVGVNKVTLADMYGNEREVETSGGVVEITLDDTPDYIIGDFGTVSVADGVAEKTAGYVINDMEEAANLSWYQSTPSKNGAIYGIKADDPDKGNVFHTYSVIGDSKLTKYTRPMVTLPERASKVLISLDAKTDVVFNEGYLMVQAVGKDSADSKDKSYAVARLADNTKQSWVYNNWQTKATEAPLVKDEWSRIDIVLDMINENVVVYKNGAKIDGGNKTSGNNFPNLTDVSHVFIDCYTEISGGASVNDGSFYLDNFSVTPIDEVGDIPAKINVWNNNVVYVNLPATLSSDSTVSATGNKLVAADGSQVTASAELIGKTGVKLTLDGAIADNKEYKVVFGKSTNLKNFINGAAVGEIKINKNTATMYKTVFDTSFDEEYWKENMTQNNVPEELVNKVNFDLSVDAGDIVGGADDTNNVLVFDDKGDDDYTDRIKFTLGAIPATKIKLRVDYKVKLSKAQDTDIYGTFYPQLWEEYSTAAAANKQTSGIGINFKYDTSPQRGIDYFTGGSAWANNGPQSLVDAAKVSYGDWYTYNHEYTLEECETYKRPVANYSVSDKDGYGVNSVLGANTCNTTIDWANEVWLDYMSVDGQAGDVAYLDDLYIGYSYANTAEPVVDVSGIKAVLVKADGTEMATASDITSDAIGIKLTLSEKPTGEISAALSDGSSVTVAKASELEYIVKWNDNINGEYTLTVSDGEAAVYTYSFNMTSLKGYNAALLAENDFDSEESDFNKPSTIHSWRDNGTLNGKALYLADNGDTTADAVNPRFMFSETKTGGKILVSFDVAVDSAVTKAELGLNLMGESVDGMGLVLKRDGDTTQNWLYNNWNPSYRFPENVLIDELKHIDVLYNMDDNTATLYIDGSLIKSENDVYNKVSFEDVRGVYMRITEGVYIDNVTILDADKYIPEIIGAKSDGENEKVMYAKLGTVLGADYTGTAKLLNIDRGAEYAVTVAGTKGSRFLAVTSTSDVDFAAAYSLSFTDEGPVDVLGIKAKNNALIAYFGSSYIEKTFAATDFSDNKLMDGAVLFASDGTASTSTSTGEVIDGVFTAKDNPWLTGMKYTLPTNLPEDYTLKVSYKTKLMPETGTTTYGGSFMAIGKADKITNTSVAAALNYNSSGAITYANNGQYWDTRNTLLSVADLSAWYTFEYEFKISGDDKPVGSYKVKDAQGKVLGEISNVAINQKQEVIGRAEALWFGHRPVATKAGSAALFDDIKISYVYEDEDINKFAFICTEGEEFAPSYNPDKLVSGISLGFNDVISEMLVSMKSADGATVPVTCAKISDYRWRVDVPLLKESKEYTLKVIYDEKVFEYSFVPLAANGIMVADFGVFQNNVKLYDMSEVITPATLKAQAKLYDFTGSNAEATLICAVYQGDALVEITYIPVTATEAGAPVEKEFNVSDKAGVTVKALLWKDVSGTIEPIVEGVHLK